MRQIRKQTIYLRMRDQGSELKTSTLATDLGRGWQGTNHLATGLRDANLKERTSPQLAHVLTLIPKRDGETTRHVNEGRHTKPM